MPCPILFPPINLVSRREKTGVSSSVPSGPRCRRISLNIHTAKKARGVFSTKSRALFHFFLPAAHGVPRERTPAVFSPPLSIRDPRDHRLLDDVSFFPEYPKHRSGDWHRVPAAYYSQKCFSLSRLIPSLCVTRSRGNIPWETYDSLMVIFCRYTTVFTSFSFATRTMPDVSARLTQVAP